MVDHYTASIDVRLIWLQAWTEGLALSAEASDGWESAAISTVVQRGTLGYSGIVAHPGERSTDVSVRQFVADSGAVTRGLRQGRTYTLTLNGEPLAKMIPIQRRRAVPKEEVLAIFATAPAIDAGGLRADLDDSLDQEVRDPFEGTGL